MTKNDILMISCTAIAAISGCAADSPAADSEQTQGAEDELATDPGGAVANVIGQFHLIRLSNTQLCLQPKGGSAGDVTVELHQCNSSAPAQNWIFVSQAGGRQVVNQQSGKCLYESSEPPTNGGTVTHEGCNVFGTSTPASNSLWNLSSLTNFSRLMSELGRRDTGFCLDGGSAFDGAPVKIFRCNFTPAQTWVVGVE